MRLFVLTLAAAVLLAPPLASAQSTTTTTQKTGTTTTTTTTTLTTSRGTTTMPTYEFSLGYQYLRTGQFCAGFDESTCNDDDPDSFPAGVMADAIRNFGRWGILGEVGWSHHDEDSVDNDPFADRLTTDVFHYAAGVRYTYRKNRFWPYFQGLGGGATSSFDGWVAGDPFHDSRTRFMAQVGGGVTFVVGDGWGLFVDGAYRRMFLDDDEDFTSGRNDVRVAGGFRLILD